MRYNEANIYKLVVIMKKNTIILILLLFSLISCNNHYNKIEITFLKSDIKDSIPIKYSLLKLSRKDSIIFNKNIIDQIVVGEKYIFDSLPNGEYILEYSNIKEDTIIKHINLKNSRIYQSKILFDSLPLEKYHKYVPINNLKSGESYKLFTWGGCMVRMESFYRISNEGNMYFMDSNVDKKRLLKKEEIKAFEKFEAGLYALREKGTCHSTGQMTYAFSKNNKKDTINEMTCNWNGYSLLMNKLYNSN
jgi:hypothetical protein